MRFPITAVGLLLACLAGSSVSSGCTFVQAANPVGSSFKVKVSGYDGPVKGLLLKLARSPDEPGRSAVTDENGIASFYNAPRGIQFLRADHDNGFDEELDVNPSRAANAVIPLKWPSIDPIPSRSLSGSMRVPGAVPGELDQSIVSLELLDAISGRILSRIDTTNRGAFDFGDRPPGLYFIHLMPFPVFSEKAEGFIAIVVDPKADAAADKLDINLQSTSCGLMYTPVNLCPEPDLHVKQLKGRVNARAQIGLLDA
jgi:hypothetical protein